jgi:hypothetical protein
MPVRLTEVSPGIVLLRTVSQKTRNAGAAGIDAGHPKTGWIDAGGRVRNRLMRW